MTTIKTERYEVTTRWNDGSKSVETRPTRERAEQVARRNRNIGAVVSVTVEATKVTVA